MLRCPLFDIFLDGHCPIHDPNPGTNQRFLVKGVGSFFKGVGVVIGHLLVCKKVGFSENSSASTSRRRDGVARHALGTPSDDCDSVRIGSYGLRIQCPGPIAPGTQ